MFAKLFGCCNTVSDGNEVKVVQLSCDDVDGGSAIQPVHLLTQADTLDMSPRKEGDGGGWRAWSPVTPRERDFQDRIRLPRMRRYPIPPGCSMDDPDEQIQEELLRTYREFVLELHKGIYMTQLTSSQEYSDIHCQILEDMQTLKVDQGSGCIIEFPLTAVSKVYRIIKNDDKWYSAGSLTGPTPMPPLPLSNAEHIVVVEFMRRKLAFVFSDMPAAQRFLMGIELLIRLAQENRGGNGPTSWRVRGKGEGTNIAPMFSGYSPKSPGDRFLQSLPLHGRGDPSTMRGQPQPRPEDGGKLCACRPEASI
uniref:Uncharacterized protein n=1 Tax=Alexandrium catenella TaxID=2925 RepID=A0A7S1L890_ALECA|mmetsp:Transcript_108340/g.288292  ORF Transcript_108340/g.288292 Transcript_108340/m.288292 type:complete len:308 (+) Transcript_108340:62-985(+)